MTIKKAQGQSLDVTGALFIVILWSNTTNEVLKIPVRINLNAPVSNRPVSYQRKT